MIARPQIFGALGAEEGSTLTLVAAPAGYGKTTAVPPRPRWHPSSRWASI
jgi:ATP/maltotriose-dependent transcriptional regulator MalT